MYKEVFQASSLILLDEIVSLISKDPPRKDDKALFTTVSLKALSDFFAHFLLIRNNAEIIRTEHFQTQKKRRYLD